MSISDQSRNVLKEQLLEAAASEFLEKGFSAASLDSIIKKAGGSKSKIYNYFGGKSGLFVQAVQYKCELILSPLKELDIYDDLQDLPSILTCFGKAFLDISLHSEAINLLRLVISESRRFDALGDIFLNSGPKHAEACLAKYIRDAHISATTFREMVPEKLASQFIDMITRRLQLRLLIGHATLISENEKSQVVNDAVALYQSH